MRFRWWMPALAAWVCLAGGLKQPFESLVAPATDVNPRNSEATLVELRGGRVMLAWRDFPTPETGESSPSRISAAVSNDQGRTWGTRFTLQEGIGGGSTLAPGLLRLKSGRILFLFSQRGPEGGLQPMMRSSTDEARTFSEPKPLPMDPASSHAGIHPDRAIQLRTGRIVVPVWFAPGASPNPNLRCRVYYSDDEGKSWKAGQTLAGLREDGGTQAPGVVELKDGRILLWASTAKGKIYRSYSSDRGETFPALVPAGIESQRPPQSMVRIPSTGDLLLVWNYASSRRFPLTTAISRDGGGSWQHFQNLDQDPAHIQASASVRFLSGRVLFAYEAGPAAASKPGKRWSLKVKAVSLDRLYDRKVVVALGDSVTLGVRTDGSVKEADTFVARLEQALGKHVVNAGIGGNNTAQMLERLDRDVLAYQPRLVIVMAGLNDGAYVDAGPVARTEPRIPAEAYRKNLRQIVERVRGTGAEVLLTTPNPMTSGYPFANFGWYQGKDINLALGPYVEAVYSVSRETGVPMVDVFRQYLSWQGYEATLPDGIHPNPAGHAFIAEKLLPECRKALARK